MSQLLEETQNALQSGNLKSDDIPVVAKNIIDDTEELTVKKPVSEEVIIEPQDNVQYDQFGGIITDEFVPEDIEPEEVKYDNFGGVIGDNTPVQYNKGLSIAQRNRSERMKNMKAAKQKQKEQLLQYAYGRYGEEIVDGWVDNPITFTEADDFSKWSEVLPLGGFKQMYDYNKLSRISEDLLAGKEVSDADNKTLNTYIDSMIEREIRGFNFGGKFRYYGTQMPAFMAEFFATGFGFGKLAQTATVQTIKQGAKRHIKNEVQRKAAKVSAEIATRTALMLPTTAKNYGELQVNNGMILTEQGQMVFREAAQSPAKAALLALLYTGTEVTSEMSGIGINKLVNKTGIKSKLNVNFQSGLSKLPPNTRAALTRAYKKIKPNARVSELFTKAGWNGVLTEIAEERVADILRETVNISLVDNYTMYDVLEGLKVDAEQLMLEGSLIMTLGAGKASISTLSNMYIENGMDKKAAIKLVEQMSEGERQSLIEQQLVLDDTPVDGPSTTGPLQISPLGKPSINDRLFEYWDKWQDQKVQDLAKGKKEAIKIVKREIKNLRKNQTKFLSVVSAAGGINEADFRQLVSQSFNNEQEITQFIKEFNERARRVTGGKNIVRTTKQNDGNTLAELFDKLKESSSTIQKSADKMTDRELADHILQRYSDSRVQFSGEAAEQADMQKFFHEGFIDGINAKHGSVNDFNSMVDKNEQADTFATRAGYSYGYYMGYWDTFRSQVPFDPPQTELQKILLQAIADPNNTYDNPDVQNSILEAQRRIDEINLTEDGLMQDYIESLQNQDIADFIEDNNIEVPEGTTPQEYLLQEGLLSDPVTDKEFAEIMSDYNEFYDNNYGVSLIMTDIQHEVIDKDGKSVVVAPQNSIFNEHYYNWVDSLGALVDLGKEAAKRGHTLPIDRLVRLYAGVTGMATQHIQNFTFEINEQGQLVKTGQGLRDILDTFDVQITQFEGSKKTRYNDLTEYLIARRYYQDLAENEEVEVTEKQLLDSIATLDRLHQKYGENLRLFDQVATDVYEFQQRTLRLLVSSGVMSEEVYEEIIAKHPNYIPFQREMDDNFGVSNNSYFGDKLFTDASLQKAIKKIKGADLDVKDPIQSIMQNTFRIVDLAWQNRIALMIGNMAEVMPDYVNKIPAPQEQVAVVDGKPVVRPSKIVPKNAVIAYREGNKEFYEVPQEVIKALEYMTMEQLGALDLLLKPLQTSALVLRTGATITPDFMAKNYFRDITQSFIYSLGKVTPIDAVKGLAHRFGKTETYQEWMASGGAFNSYMDLSDTGIQKVQEEVMSPKGKLWKYLSNPLALPQDLSMGIEQSVRIGAYLKAKKRGASDADAGMLSRDITIDFARGGYSAKTINRYVPFFNAGVQGMDKMYRAFRDNPMMTTMYATATLTLPQLALTTYFLYYAKEEEREAYLNAPQWMRDTYFIIPHEGKLVTIPKPFSMGYIFASMPERFMLWNYENGRQDGLDIATDLLMGGISATVPVDSAAGLTPTALKTYFELGSNHSFFRDEAIYPDFLDALDPEERKTKYTSDTAVALGEKFGISPAKVEYVIRAQFGGTGEYMMDASDKILQSFRKWNGEDVPEKIKRDFDYPLIKSFLRPYPEGNRAQVTMEVYDLAKEIEQRTKTANKKDGEELKAYKAKHKAIFDSERYVKGRMKQIRRQNKKLNKLHENLTKSAEEKQEEAAEINRKIREYARQAMDRFLQNLEESK